MVLGNLLKAKADELKISSIVGRGSIKTKLFICLIPPIILILVATGVISYHFSSSFIRNGLERAAQAQAIALAGKVESTFEICRRDLQHIAQENPTIDKLPDYLRNFNKYGEIKYRELAYISQTNDPHAYFVAVNNQVVKISASSIEKIHPNPFAYYDTIKAAGAGNIWMSAALRAQYPIPANDNPNQILICNVIYLGTWVGGESGRSNGYFLLSIDVKSLRDMISKYVSEGLPLWADSRNTDQLYSFLFDTDGWIMFESGRASSPGADLTTDRARSGYIGTLGKPELPSGFKPAERYSKFWEMVKSIREDKSGIVYPDIQVEKVGPVQDHFLAFAPIHIAGQKNGKPMVYAGTAIANDTRLTESAGFKQVDVMFIITLATIFLISVLILVLGYMVTRPLTVLAQKVNAMHQSGRIEPLALRFSDKELAVLSASINNLIDTVNVQGKDIQSRDQEKDAAALKDQTPLADDDPVLIQPPEIIEIPGLLGTGPKIEKLRMEILKAAQTDVDVLIIGETGTGKQLTAEAIHLLGVRADKPFVSINCGELDENLLIDTLFGHVRGAFTEAKTDRRGAFAEAGSGILFLDEIQTASGLVQQALLRAISQRCIKPLGSDKETPVDVRLIVATNADLKSMMDQGKFRQDLYYRLKVITVYPPALREHPESIPILVGHYFRQAKRVARKHHLSLTRGALEKLKRYEWPGNIRELMNCIMRAVVMSEGPLIRTEDVLLEGEQAESAYPRAAGVHAALAAPAPPTPGADAASLPHGVTLNKRQAAAWPHIARKGSVTRSEYQERAGGKLSSRMAIYDLQGLVQKGLLDKTGQGPATCYVVSKNPGGHPGKEGV
jgi:transcriptional regulator with AAA-type ATPase domain